MRAEKYFEFGKKVRDTFIQKIKQEEMVAEAAEKDGIISLEIQGEVTNISFDFENKEKTFVIDSSSPIDEKTKQYIKEVVISLDPSFYVTVNHSHIETPFYKQIVPIYKILGEESLQTRMYMNLSNMFRFELEYILNNENRTVEVWFRGMLYKVLHNEEEATAFRLFMDGSHTDLFMFEIQEECGFLERSGPQQYKYAVVDAGERITVTLRVYYEFDMIHGYHYVIHMESEKGFKRLKIFELDQDAKNQIKQYFQDVQYVMQLRKKIGEEFAKKNTHYFFDKHYRKLYLSLEKTKEFDLEIKIDRNENYEHGIQYTANLSLEVSGGRTKIITHFEEELRETAATEMKKKIAKDRMELVMGEKADQIKWSKLYALFGEQNYSQFHWSYDQEKYNLQEIQEELASRLKDIYEIDTRSYVEILETERFEFRLVKTKKGERTVFITERNDENTEMK